MSKTPPLRATDKFLSETERKIRDFAKLPPGWFYGAGSAIEEHIIQAAMRLNDAAKKVGVYTTDVFPAESGELMFTLYSGEDYLELTIESDGTLSAVRERDDQVIEARDGLSLDEAIDEISEFRNRAWKPSVYLSESNGIAGKVDSSAWRSKIRATTPAYQSLTRNAPTKAAEEFALTSPATTRLRQITERYSGASKQHSYPME